MVWALVPVKDLVLAKSRLAGVLAPSERRALAQAMVEDVLAVLVAEPVFDGVLLISDDPAAEMIAHKYGIEWVAERTLECKGLNGAVAAGRNLLAERGVTDVMVLHSDIPLLSTEDIAQLLTDYEAEGVDVLIASDLAGTGTNIMLMPTRPALPLHYGEGSCRAHQLAAETMGLQVKTLRSETMGLDIDCPEDLLDACHRLQERQLESNCARLILASDIAQRLKIMESSGLGLDPESDTQVEQHDLI
jgi:2-phospho-L-lactate guanylyltransferase